MKTEQITRSWPDIDAEVIATIGEFHVEFRVSIRDEQDQIVGYVKWDGCSNWKFADGHYLHRCDGPEVLRNIGEALGRCYELAKELTDWTDL